MEHAPKQRRFLTEEKAEFWVLNVRRRVGVARCDEGLRDQIRRASASVLLNIAEGAGYRSPRAQSRHYIIARASLAETLAALRLLRGEGGLDDATFTELQTGADEISRMLWGLLRAANGVAGDKKRHH
jgi:four helix bundle protein